MDWAGFFQRLPNALATGPPLLVRSTSRMEFEEINFGQVKQHMVEENPSAEISRHDSRLHQRL